jgi:hypothetical protein
MTEDRTVIVTTKNEGPFLLEWITYHQLIGFNNIVVFANDCEDGSDVLLQRLNNAGIIRYFDNSEVIEGLPGDPQKRAYRRAFAMDHVLASEWVLVVDADEFFNIHVGNGTIDDLLAATGPCDVIGAPWCVFGNGGKITYNPDLIIDQFKRAAPKDVQVSLRHYGLKFMFRPGPIQRLGVHRPFLKGEHKKPNSGLKWVNGSGKDVTEHYREKGWSASPANVGYDLCQVNHYMIKANELFLMKRYRGTANSVDADRINFDYYNKFNSNHIEETTICHWADRVRMKISEIRKLYPDIADAEDTCVRFFHDRIEGLTRDLKKNDPEVSATLLSPKAVDEGIKKDELWTLRARRRKAQTKNGAVHATPRASVVSNTAADPQTNDAIKPENAAPNWLLDLRRSDHRKGFYHSDEKFAAQFTERSRDVLIVSFDNLSSVRDPSLARESWGYGFYEAEGWSHLGIMCFETNWYRDEALFDYLEDLAARGFFKAFKKVVMTGTSMGAYASTAFAPLAPGCTVVTYSPQSTLDTNLVPWEKRFGSGRKQDWSGRYADAAQTVGESGKAFIFYDPGFEPDRLHAVRYKGAPVHLLKTWFTGHKSALFMRRAELLKPIMHAAVDGTLTEASFYKAYRNRRKLSWYINGLCEKSILKNHLYLTEKIGDALIRDGRPNIGKSVHEKVQEARSS